LIVAVVIWFLIKEQIPKDEESTFKNFDPIKDRVYH